MIVDCQVQQYAWGKAGAQSEVARLKRAADPVFTIESDKNYAELWMGTHPSCPARVGNVLLSDYLLTNPEYVGIVPNGYNNTDLPFLFKVLSIKTALSIQAHPDKELAKELHTNFPSVYKDPNHKPEMAVALTPFQGLSGFRSIDDIKTKLEYFPEVKSLLSENVKTALLGVSDQSDVSARTEVIKSLFADIMRGNETIIHTQVVSMVDRLTSALGKMAPVQSGEPPPKQLCVATPGDLDEIRRLSEVIIQLNKDYPGDVGVVMPILLNYIELAPGEGFFMGPNEPHAYISGDCVEVMALSDNVVRAGLTPKLRDVDTLCRMLHYRSGKPEIVTPVPIALSDTGSCAVRTLLYRPDPTICSEFELEQVTIEVGSLLTCSEPQFRALPTASILLFISAKTCGLECQDGPKKTTIVRVGEGTVLFLPANVSAMLRDPSGVLSGKGGPFKVFRAHINLSKYES